MGVVVAKETGLTLAYGIVSVPSMGVERFATVNGTFVITNVRVGSVGLIVRRIGYLPRSVSVDVRAGMSDTVRIEMTRVAFRLAAVRVSAYPECKKPGPPDPAEDAVLAAIFEQVKMNAEQYRFLAQSHPFAYVVQAVRGHVDTAGARREEQREMIRLDGISDWRYQPGKITTRGLRGMKKGELLVNIPTLVDFADSTFLWNHCFHNGGLASLDTGTQYRLDFTASSKIKASDFFGSIYLDTTSYQIRRSVLQVIPPPPVRGMSAMEVVTDFAEVLPSIPVIASVSSQQTFNTMLRGVVYPLGFEEQKLVTFLFLAARPGEESRQSVGAQATACLAPDSATTFIQDELVHLVTATDTGSVRARNSVNLPALSASDVELVSDPAVCGKAALQLAAIAPGGDPSPAAGVFRVGPTRYVAFNARQKVHGSGYLYVFDQDFVRLASFRL